MDAPPASIRTPDQRIRVFLSSTLRELEPERRAARAAIESLQLAPVMFELGARPHPPRSLYRSYLAQSDIFVGIYAEKYGWVAPDEQISGLEDEYVLSAGMPRLMYLREHAPDREERLTALLDRMRDEDTTSYRTFSDPDELRTLITADLAILLAERFDAARAGAGPAPASSGRPAPRSVPAAYSAIVGRERERTAVQDLLGSPGIRLVTLVGPGGIGKSRLAIEIASERAGRGGDVAFATLESVSSPDRVITAIARALGVRDNGEEPLDDKVHSALSERELLLVVDNMEHVLDATPLLVQLITDAPRLQLLVTSRSPLRVRAEHTVEIGPLDSPAPNATLTDAAASPAVTLFLHRATAVRPDFRLTPGNVAAVVGLCRALDGVPLALELAAARVRTMTPADILRRLDSALTLLVGGARDLPARQQALRSTIEWSVRLLDDRDREAFAALSVFTGPFTLDAAVAVLGGVDDALTEVEALTDASLLWQRDRGGIRVFGMLSLVRQYAGELLDAEAAAAAKSAWSAHYRTLADEASDGLDGPEQLDWLARLEAEAENIAGVMRWLLDARELDRAAELAWSLYMYQWLAGLLGLQREWMGELLSLSEADGLPLTEHAEAIARYYTLAIGFWIDPDLDVVPGLERSAALFEASGDIGGAALTRVSIALALLSRSTGPEVAPAWSELERSLAGFREAKDAWGQAMTLVTLGRVQLLTGDVAGAGARFDESLGLATDAGERLGIVIAQNHRAWSRFLSGNVAAAEADFAEGVDVSVALGHEEGIAYGLEGLVAVQAVAGRATEAGLLLGVARTLRRRAGILNAPAFAFYEAPLQALRDGGAGDEIDAGTERGSTLSVAEVLDLVRD